MKFVPQIVTIAPMRRILPLFPILLLACQQVSHVDNGDQLFKVGRYRAALDEYQLAHEAEEEVFALGRRVAETKFRILAEQVKLQLQTHHPHLALSLLQDGEKIRPGHPLIDELRIRSFRLISDELVVKANDLLVADDVDQAVALFTRALEWRPEHPAAADGLARAQDRAGVLFRKGEEYFFLGLAELEIDKSGRALTAFRNAMNYHGGDSRAAFQAEVIAESISELQMRKAQALIDSGMHGPALLSARDAIDLNPENEKAVAMVVALEKEMATTDNLMSAEIHARGSRLDEARAYVANAAASQTQVAAQELPVVELFIMKEADRLDYLLARSCELDQQFVRALALYKGIESRNPNHIYTNLQLQIDLAQSVIAEATALRKSSEVAQASGDFDGSRELLAESRRLVRDLD